MRVNLIFSFFHHVETVLFVEYYLVMIVLSIITKVFNKSVVE